MLITDCSLSGFPALCIDGSKASCASCGEVVYPELVVLHAHDITNHGASSAWWSRDMECFVHRCGVHASVTVEEFTAVDA
jgi:hypothetical protein